MSQTPNASRARRFDLVFLCIYAAFGVGTAVAYAIERDWLFALVSLSTLLLFPSRSLARHIFAGTDISGLARVLSVFIFCSYTLGVPCGFYRIVPYYDKLMNGLSGTLTLYLALLWFYALKSNHRVERTDERLVIAFALMTAIAVAGLWELLEYPVGLISGIDNQRVLTTGISDTMQDMAVATLGACALIPSIHLFYTKDRRGLVMGSAADFIASRAERRPL